MTVALDMQLALGTATGIGEYARGLADALRERGTGVVELAEPNLDPWRFDRRVIWDQVLLPQRARRSGATLLHCLSGTMPRISALPVAVTVHDVAWLKVQAHARAYARWYFGAFSLKRYRCAAAILVDSAFSKRELLGVLDVPPEQVQVIYPGVARDFCALERRAVVEPFVLVPGTVERRKNLEVLIRAIVAVPSARLVSVGPFTRYREECERLAHELGVADRLDLRGYVSRAELCDLYATCALVAVPSRYEGFGYPAAQALCAGAPLLVSNAASLPEVAGSGVPVLDPDDVAGWTREIAAIIEDAPAANARAAALRDAAIARFDWSTAAGAVQRVYAKLLAVEGCPDSVASRPR